VHALAFARFTVKACLGIHHGWGRCVATAMATIVINLLITISISLIPETKSSKESRVASYIDVPPVAEAFEDIKIVALLWMRLVSFAFNIVIRIKLTSREAILHIIIILVANLAIRDIPASIWTIVRFNCEYF